LDLVRRKQLRPIPDDVLDSLHARWTDPNGAGRPEHVDALNRCLGKLADSARRLLWLKYQEGLTATEIAHRLRRSEDAIYQSLYRIHRALKGCVAQELAHESGEGASS
jgi:RNA polymerase sigma-70 factor (ECF subfamily)